MLNTQASLLPPGVQHFIVVNDFVIVCLHNMPPLSLLLFLFHSVVSSAFSFGIRWKVPQSHLHQRWKTHDRCFHHTRFVTHRYHQTNRNSLRRFQLSTSQIMEICTKNNFFTTKIQEKSWISCYFFWELVVSLQQLLKTWAYEKSLRRKPETLSMCQ